MQNIAIPIVIATTFEEMDAFGTPIELNYNKKTVYKTKWGATLTILCGFLSFSAIIIYGKEVIERQNPTVITNEFLMPRSELIKLNGTFQFFFGLINSDFVPLKDQNATLFNFTVQYIDKLQNKTIKLDVDYCANSNSMKDPKVRELFVDVDIDKLFCLKDTQQFTDLEFKGQFGSTNYKYLQISIQTCTTITCGSQSIIDYLNSSYFIYYFTEIVFNPKEYDSPLTRFSNSIYTRVSLFNKKNLLFKMKHTEYLTDQGYFTEEMINNNFTTFDTYLESIRLNPKNEPDIITFQTQVGDKANRIQRKYIKITDLMAYLGGFLKIIFLLCQIIALPINQIALQTEFANQIFNFEKPPKKKKNNNKQYKSIKQETETTENEYQQPKKGQQLQQLNQEESKENNFLFNNEIKFPTKPPAKDNQFQNNQQSKKIASLSEIPPFQKKTNNNKVAVFPETAANQLQQQQQQQPNPDPPLAQRFSKKKKGGTIVEDNGPQCQPTPSENNFNLSRKKKMSLNDQALGFSLKEKEDNLLSPTKKAGKLKSRQTCFNVPKELKQKKKVKKIEIMQQMMKKANENNPEILTETEYNNILLKIGKKVKKDAHIIFNELFAILHKNIQLQVKDYAKYIWNSIKEKLLCSKRRLNQSEQIQHAIKLLTERMDIVFIMKKLMEIEKIKMLILDKDQREIFQYLPKPLVKYDPNHADAEAYNLAANYQDLLFNQKEEKSYEKCLRAAKAYQRIKGKYKQSKMDQNVLEIIGDRSQKLLNFLDQEDRSPTQKHQKRNGSNEHEPTERSKNEIQLRLNDNSQYASHKDIITPKQVNSNRQLILPIQQEEQNQIESLRNIPQLVNPEVHQIGSAQASKQEINIPTKKDQEENSNLFPKEKDQN